MTKQDQRQLLDYRIHEAEKWRKMTEGALERMEAFLRLLHEGRANLANTLRQAILLSQWAAHASYEAQKIATEDGKNREIKWRAAQAKSNNRQVRRELWRLAGALEVEHACTGTADDGEWLRLPEYATQPVEDLRRAGKDKGRPRAAQE